MKALGRWSVEHRVSVNLIMVFLIVAGLYTAMTMKREMFPQFSMDMIHISVPYPGASPEEVEEGICIRIEEQLKSLEDVKTMYASAIEGNGSVNMLSLFGFIMTLGILVDDAIIVGENVYTHYSEGKPPKEAVLAAMDQVGGPVVMAVTTTIVAFAPLLFIEGIMGKFISVMPKVVICILALSLVEAFLILPAHLAGTLTPRHPFRPRWYGLLFFWFEWVRKDLSDGHAWLRLRVEKALNRVIQRLYLPVLRYCVENRYFTVALGVGCLIVSLGLIAGGPGGSPIEIRMKGDDLEMLAAAVKDLKAEIATYPGTFDITDDFRPGKMEKQMIIKPGAEALGVTMADIATQIRQAYYGDEVLQIQRGKNDIKVMVRYSEPERSTEASIDELRIRTRDNREIPLNQVAGITTARGYSTIQRVDRRRVITVTSDLEEEKANARKIVQDLKGGYLAELARKYPGVSYDLEGQAQRSQESMESLITGFAVAAMVIFLLLASQFRSYLQPVIIMCAIPFGLVGAISGHFIMGLAAATVLTLVFVPALYVVVKDITMLGTGQ